MNKQKILQLLGLATRARMTISGEEMSVSEVRKGKAKLVIISEDASDNTHKKLHDKCKSNGVELRVFGSRYELGHAIGKEERVVIAITDSGFAKKLISLIEEINRGRADDQNSST
ncbi:MULTISPECIES: YlxQ family RNA-binding protein [Planococcus]|uniref:50S ribosomal protein L7 n=2 Tax=Planococcus TaxID=1372 RepID=A0ABM5WVF5_9BACL|nr:MULTISPECIES: YlxQ family RNA-binding protein [Planococcus]ALS78289.1 50S ribosomal protein L7 [Planococcus kocurii]AQU79807.1 50S ribosomal protein L7 [Planococcus faecalis]KAA0958318.1 YlxQ family RNA-binding protein [Planococcus sp. ANT_H30]MDJ0330832.1 YlxQ family RNA-binding protein [Planococcus sp. S3-L1]OHX52633.1 50S ribosomal protein L7 [Planococcus faecalis]